MIAVLGAGSWGIALAVVLAKKSPAQQVLLWGRSSYTKYLPDDIALPKNIIFTNDLIAAVQQTQQLLLAIPSYAFTDLISQILPYINTKNIQIAWATKGLDAKTGKFFSEILTDLLGEQIAMAVLSGPSFAKEVIKQMPTAIAIAGRQVPQDQAFVDNLINKFNSSIFRLHSCNDIIGVQLGGVLKNILAVLSGICDGLKLGSNTKAAFITAGFEEGAWLLQSLGGSQNTLMGLSGLGDMFLSCTDQQSRNRKFGLLLAEGITVEQAIAQIGQAIEAISNIGHLYKLSRTHKVNMPLVRIMWEVLINKMPVKQAIKLLFVTEELAVY